MAVTLAVYTLSAELGRVMTLNDFFVKPENWWKGVGRELAKQLVEGCKLMRIDEIGLEVLHGNKTASSFWKCVVFKPADRFLFRQKTGTSYWQESDALISETDQRKCCKESVVVTEESNIEADGQNQAKAPPPPAPPPSTYAVRPQAQELTCPTCFTTFPLGTQFCPQCGTAIPPPTWGPIPATAPPSKRPVKLIVGIVLIALLLVGVGGFVVYNNVQRQILQAAKTSDRNAANQSVNQLQPTCISVRTDSSTLYGSPGSFTGYRTVYETLGISNPTRFAMDATWALTLNYPSVGWVLADTESFHLSANGIAHPIFSYRVSGSQLNNLHPNPNLTTFTVTLNATYVVTGTYATYMLTQNSNYDSSTMSGDGFLASGTSNMPSC